MRATFNRMGILRACVCSVVLMAAATSIGACSGDDGGGSSSPACHCEWGDTCEELSADCSTTECESNGESVKASGACAQTDVTGSCDCPSDAMVIYYRNSFVGSAQEDCEFWCTDGVYTAR